MTFINLLKDSETKKRLLFTIFILAVCYLLAKIPVYGIKTDFLAELFASSSITGFMDTMAGGSFSQLAVAGFGITSYITATIVVQLLSVVFPKLEKIQRDGERGRKQIEKISFVLALLITLIGSLSLSIAYGSSGLFEHYSALSIVIAVVSWLAGTAAIVLLARSIEDHGVGNGTSMVLGMNIMSRIPGNIINFYNEESDSGQGVIALCILTVCLYLFYMITIYLQKGMLNIPLLQTKKGASIMNNAGVLPVSVNVANVLPVIYAASIMAMPSFIIFILKIDTEGTVQKVIESMQSTNWYNPTTWYHVTGFIVYLLLIAVFGLFASKLTFCSEEIAENMKKNGDVIPSVTPGNDTIVYLEKRRKIMTMINVTFLIVIAVVPDFVCARLGISHFTFLGTSLIIIVSVLYDTGLRCMAASIHNDKKFALFPKLKEA